MYFAVDFSLPSRPSSVVEPLAVVPPFSKLAVSMVLLQMVWTAGCHWSVVRTTDTRMDRPGNGLQLTLPIRMNPF